ncbi:MAG: ferrous iron transport protein B [Chloracidobacterium sp.]|nr:ferrous iron transport protein B [Chloracidobacterium sp.]
MPRDADDRSITVVLAGNPNAGKTSLFNQLTGLKQKVANYPGVTVERKEGHWQLGDRSATLIDLPGLYSLDATSLDEQIARNVITGQQSGVRKPDVVIAVVDATNLERNLYLVTQLYDFDVPVIVALTMMDSYEGLAEEIDVERLSRTLKVPVVPVNARAGEGLDELAAKITPLIGTHPEVPEIPEPDQSGPHGKIFARYNFISNAVQDSARVGDGKAHLRSSKIDKVLTHKFFGLVILIGILMIVFQAIFSWATLPMELLEGVFGAMSDAVKTSLPPGILTDLLADGMIAGVGGVVVFLPQILLLFLFISILEDTGYMARAAFLMDKLMSRVGLHGKAFLPLMSGFACAIPAIMATRTIEDRRDRFATMLVAPFMSCSARLPVYTLMIGAFFGTQYVFGFISLGAVLMLLMYAIGIFVAIAVAFILKRTLLKAPPPPFLMEMPPYRLPNVRTVVMSMISRAWLFLKRAGTVILAISIILWALTYFPRTLNTVQPAGAAVAAETAEAGGESEEEKVAESEQIKHSFAGMLGHAIEPVIKPLGFDWKIGVALIASFAAREVIVSTLSIIYSVGKDENEGSQTLIAAVRDAKTDDGRPAWTPLTALSMMVFFVLAMQCVSTLAVVRRETNSWRWPIFMFSYMTVIAYAAAFITYQGGKLLGFE